MSEDITMDKDNPPNNVSNQVIEEDNSIMINDELIENRKYAYSNCSNNAPNRMVSFDYFKSFIESKIKKCPVCKSPNIQLIESSRVGLASSFLIHCIKCEMECEKAKRKYKYYQIRYDKQSYQNDEDSAKKRKKDRKLYFDLRNAKTKLKKL